MKIFDKRPLSLILCVLLGAFVFFTLGGNTERLVLISVGMLFVISAIFFRELLNKTRVMLSICGAAVLLASLFSYLYFNLWFNAYDRFDNRCEIIGTIETTDFDSANPKAEIKTDSINGKIFTSYNLIVRFEDTNIENITVGSKIKFSADLVNFTPTGDFDSETYYKAKGFSAIAINVTDTEILSQSKVTLSQRITSYRLSLSRRIILNTDRRTGGLLSALLLGERSYLDGQISLDFQRIGISHILALSGMHIAILCYGLSSLLSFFRLDKRIRKLLEIIFAFCYAALTGFSVSVLRAALMLIISSLLFLFSRSKDLVTNLHLSVAVIVIVTPHAIFDVSLWLSAFATLGIIVFSELRKNIDFSPKNIFARFALNRLASVLSTVFALLSTIAVSAFSYNSISLIAPIATFIFSPLILIFMYAGIVFLVLNSLVPLGSIIVFIGDLILDFASLISSFKYSLLSVNHFLLDFLVIAVTLALILFFILDIKKKVLATTVIATSLLSVILGAFVYTSASFNRFSFVYDGTTNDERILIKNDSETTLIELGLLDYDLAYSTYSYANENTLLYLDNYVVTAYDVYSTDAIGYLLSKVMISNIYLPTPKNQSDIDFLNNIESVKRGYNAEIHYYSNDDVLSLGEFDINTVYVEGDGIFALGIVYKDEVYSYLSSKMLDRSRKNYALKVMNSAVNTVIIGGDDRTVDNFDYKIDGETKIIYKNSGLPKEILEFYENRITVAPYSPIELYVE